jgi:hypothetical protein
MQQTTVTENIETMNELEINGNSSRDDDSCPEFDSIKEEADFYKQKYKVRLILLSLFYRKATNVKHI